MAKQIEFTQTNPAGRKYLKKKAKPKAKSRARQRYGTSSQKPNGEPGFVKSARRAMGRGRLKRQ